MALPDLSQLPLVLAGPILRRVDEAHIAVMGDPGPLVLKLGTAAGRRDVLTQLGWRATAQN